MSFDMLALEPGRAVACIRKSLNDINSLVAIRHYYFRANTMSSALEVLGMSLPYSSGIPAIYPGSYSIFYSVNKLLIFACELRENT